MRIRNILILSFLFATLVPSIIFGWWTYNTGIQREFDEVKDRHLLIAQNLGGALERYYVDLTGAFDSISAAMLSGQDIPKLSELMRGLNIVCILLLDDTDGRIISRAEPAPGSKLRAQTHVPKAMLDMVREISVRDQTTFSNVIEGPSGTNEILAVHQFDNHVAVARIGTSYFISLGKSVAFGDKGHAAIVDKAGNVLAHPLADWVASRKNIAKVSAVGRMMNGETGIEQFYSPAMKGDMIAGLTTVSGPGWGVMVPQPISEIYDKVFANNISIVALLVAGVSLTFMIVFMLIGSLTAPIERMVGNLRDNARNRTLQRTTASHGLIPLYELQEFEKSYNYMVDRVSNAHQQIRHLAYTDSVTDLPNREKLQHLASRAVDHGIDTGKGGSLFFIDLDDFKEINDIHGHDVGDEFLWACARKLEDAALKLGDGTLADGTADTVEKPILARIGGDEFALVAPGIVEEDELQSLLLTLRAALSQASEEMSFIAQCSASIGCVRYPDDGTTVEGLLKRADIAMFHAKKAGKGRSQTYTPAIGTRTSAEVRRDVENAIENDELVLEYQPKIRTCDWSTCGVEALVRWDHPEHGRIPPGMWLPDLTNSPVIAKLGEWVVEKAIEDHRIWTEQGHDLTVAVNIASGHFVTPGFADKLAATLRARNFDSSKIEIEVTEDALLSNMDRAEAAVHRLHELGIATSIDDFGKGYSNIARLSHLPVDCIKIDRSIVSGSRDDKRMAAIMQCVLSMAASLGCETVAEGVETLQEAQFATQLGADMLQGFYFSKSLSSADLLEWLKRSRSSPVHDAQTLLGQAIGR